MPGWLNRDSVILWLGLAVAVVGYLKTAAKPPQEWAYAEWLQAASFVLAWLMGKLATSPLAGRKGTGNGSMVDKIAKSVPVLLLAAILGASTIAMGCAAKAPPNLSPAATQAWYQTRVIKSLDVLRDIAIAGNEQFPPLVSTGTTRQIVLYHRSTLDVMRASRAGWQPAVVAALDELLRNLPVAERAQLAPYAALAKIVLQEVIQ